MNLKRFCETIMADPTVQQHIRDTVARYEAAPGHIFRTKVNHCGGTVTNWIGGDIAKVLRSNLPELQAMRDDGSLAFDFCVYAMVGEFAYIGKIEEAVKQ